LKIAEEERKEYEVTVLSHDDITTFPRIGEAVETRMVTYVAAGLPPMTINIPKKEWTLELEKKLIREDIERRLKFKPETYRV